MMDEGEALIVDTDHSCIQWKQLMSVMIQAFASFGYVDIAEKLKSEIPDNLQPMKLANLRTEFLGGFYDKCAETLCRIKGLTPTAVSGAMKYIISMWLIERAALRDTGFDAVRVRRSTYMRRVSQADLNEMERLTDAIRSSFNNLNILEVALELRREMLEQLELVLPCATPNLHEKILKWIEYGVSAQIYTCLSHNTNDVIPLYCDHSCIEDHLPTMTIQILTGHHDCVSCVKFSHNGLYLASGSLDHTAIIWEVQDGFQLINKHVLPGHRGAISFVSWSPNDESLLTCSPEEHIKMWDVCTGQCTHVISEGNQVLRSCAFLKAYPIEIVYGTSMQSESIRLLRNGYCFELVSFPRPEGCLTVDLAVTPDGSKLIFYDSLDGEGTFTIMSINTRRYRNFKEGVRICGISVSEDSKSLILNLVNHEIHVWDLNRLGENERPLTYWNFKPIFDGNFPCMGGVGSRFLVSGTQDAEVCIWNRRQATPIAVLSGHTDAVRCVSWNPVKPQMLASASDDHTIRIWGPHTQEVPHLFIRH